MYSIDNMVEVIISLPYSENNLRSRVPVDRVLSPG